MSTAGELALVARPTADGGVELVAPCPGVLTRAPRRASAAGPGQPLGEFEVLGRRHRLVAPAGIDGVVVEPAARGPLGFGDRVALVRAATVAGDGAMAIPGVAGTPSTAASGLVLRAPSSGRYYRRAAPDQPAFVEDGAELTLGQAVGLLEVMKTFSRIPYAGDGLPSRARVVRVVPADGADVEAGDVLLELTPA